MVPQIGGFGFNGPHNQGHVDRAHALSLRVEDGDLAVTYGGQEHEGVEEVIVFPNCGAAVGWDHKLVLAME